MDVTIIVCVKNRADLIEHTITSICEQKDCQFSLLIKDGVSSDGTLDTIKKILNKYDMKRYLIVSERDSSLAEAFNQSLCYLGDGSSIFIHSDDTFINDHSLNLLLSTSTSGLWSFGFYQFIGELGNFLCKEKITSTKSHFRMMISNQVRHQAALVPNGLLKRIRFSNYKMALDYDFFLNLWKFQRPVVIPEHITNFRLHNNLSADFSGSLRNEMQVRIHYRIFHGNVFLILYDFIVFCLRYIKIMVMHKSVL
jgi:glycosyltransferase involved in cell wall biosynthesis